MFPPTDCLTPRMATVDIRGRAGGWRDSCVLAAGLEGTDPICLPRAGWQLSKESLWAISHRGTTFGANAHAA